MKTVREEIVQDSARERLVTELLDLAETGRRTGVDAYDANGNAYEIKGTTRPVVAMASSVSMNVISKLRTCYLLVVTGRNYSSGFEAQELMVASPADLEVAYSAWEERIRVRSGSLTDVLMAAERGGASSGSIAVVRKLSSTASCVPFVSLKMDFLRSVSAPLDHHRPLVARRQLTDFTKSHPISCQASRDGAQLALFSAKCVDDALANSPAAA